MIAHSQSYLHTDGGRTTELAMRYQPGGYTAEVREYLVAQVADDISIPVSVPVCVRVAARPAQRFNYLAWRQFLITNRDRFYAGGFDSQLEDQLVTQGTGS